MSDNMPITPRRASSSKGSPFSTEAKLRIHIGPAMSAGNLPLTYTISTGSVYDHIASGVHRHPAELMVNHRFPTRAIIDYTNWRGVRELRTIVPLGYRYAATDWHPAETWLVHAWDVKKRASRHFMIAGIHAWLPWLGW